MGYPGLSPGAVGTVLVGSGVVGGAEMERGASNAGSGVSVDSNSGEEDVLEPPVLWKSRKSAHRFLVRNFSILLYSQKLELD